MYLTVASGSKIDPSWFALDASRGLDDPSLKIFMRATALASEYAVYIPAIAILVRRLARLESVSTWDAYVALAAILMQPATILIDHGHFQYNTVMLGLSAATISSLMAGRIRIACIFFVGALGFKQMALFYAPAVFAYLLGVSIVPQIDIVRLITIAVVTILSFAALFAPLLLGAVYDNSQGVVIHEYLEPPLLSLIPFPLDPNNLLHVPIVQLAQCIHRVFPFARGLFEDKVANVWCALHTFHKLHQYPASLVQKAALLGTLATILPPCLILLLKPRKDLLPLAFASTAWGFFLCSYQVHEKNILLPLLPMTVLLATRDGLLPYTRAWVGFANVLGSWTMFPLLKRDGLQVPYFVLTLLWAYFLALPLPSLAGFEPSSLKSRSGILTSLIHIPFYWAMAVWHIAILFVPPPKDKPDLWTVANVLVGASGFLLCYLWCLWSLFQRAGWGTQMDVSKRKKAE
jgi:alpha-1,3-glucosyltransferase